MKFIFKETRLTDGSLVTDVQLVANGKSSLHGMALDPICIFSCFSEGDARAFLRGLERLVAKHTSETLDEVEI